MLSRIAASRARGLTLAALPRCRISQLAHFLGAHDERIIAEPQFFDGRLQLLVHGLELFVARLQFLVERPDLLGRGLLQLPGEQELIVDALQLQVGAAQFLVRRLQLAIDRRHLF